jgi:EAL domain-containing protein (putative c-di-GMP-specific phosphodiesterase class I)/DNA-binding response OmpR family regulator
MSEKPVVLVADDDPDIVELLRIHLRGLDVKVLTAKDGEEALEIAQRELPDVVLLDVQMPKRTGWDVTQALKAVGRTQDIAVVLITGKGDVKDRLTGLQLGADDYLVKPIHRGEVLKRVGDLVARRRGMTYRRIREEPEDADQTPVPSVDPATGLPTIPAVLDRLKELMIEKSEVGVVYIDIEQYEAIEAEYGWAFFDEFLRRSADVIREEAQKRFVEPVIAVNRLAGSSFYIFVDPTAPAVKLEALEKEAEDLRSHLVLTLRERFQQMQAEQVGFFAGSACVRYDPQIRLERQIYAGMRTALEAVRSAEDQKKKQLTAELKEIIRRRQVTPLFQPIVHADDGAIFGYEILTRGPSQSSFRNSDMLFAFARETHLAWELEATALKILLERLRNMDLGDRKFLLNLEAEMFSEEDFRFHEVVDFFAGHRGRFVFELTERAAIEDYSVFRELLQDFRAKGIEIAIDDAGSGYASLEAIASLAPDYLKITKGLISALPEEPIKQDLVRMLVELAHRINARTIAEGIETKDEYTCCRDLGIDLMQGYYFAHPQKDIDPAPKPRIAAR